MPPACLRSTGPAASRVRSHVVSLSPTHLSSDKGYLGFTWNDHRAQPIERQRHRPGREKRQQPHQAKNRRIDVSVVGQSTSHARDHALAPRAIQAMFQFHAASTQQPAPRLQQPDDTAGRSTLTKPDSAAPTIGYNPRTSGAVRSKICSTSTAGKPASRIQAKVRAYVSKLSSTGKSLPGNR